MTPTITNHGATVEVRHDQAMHYATLCLRRSVFAGDRDYYLTSPEPERRAVAVEVRDSLARLIADLASDGVPPHPETMHAYRAFRRLCALHRAAGRQSHG